MKSAPPSSADLASATECVETPIRKSSRPVFAAAAKTGLDDFLIGVSTHSVAEAKSAEDGGADFIVCGPVYDTPSKRAFGPPLGLDVFAEILDAVKTPVLAIGGINLSNYQEPLRRGAAGVAAI